MRATTAILQWIVRIVGIVQIVTGLLFWIGRAINLVPLHMMTGLILTIAILILTIFAGITGAQRGMIVAAVLLVIALPALGMTQTALLIGPWHWVIRVLHLLIGLAALRLGETFANHILRGSAHAHHTRLSSV
ncbi:MAG TPA: hypothetical protein VFZ21_14650 [Gemmatimonadaceae bacterium]|nr:hypothetical protein [Gemmatimonadaceae bacterium]